MAVIRVGEGSEVEVGEKKHRYDNALNAACATVEEGILPGGGIALLEISLALSTNSSGTANLSTNADTKTVLTANFDKDLGVPIICCALIHPGCTTLGNAGKESSVIVRTLLSQYRTLGKFAWGYNVQGSTSKLGSSTHLRLLGLHLWMLLGCEFIDCE